MLRHHGVYAGAEGVWVTREDALDGQQNGVNSKFVARVLLGRRGGGKLER